MGASSPEPTEIRQIYTSFIRRFQSLTKSQLRFVAATGALVWLDQRQSSVRARRASSRGTGSHIAAKGCQRIPCASPELVQHASDVSPGSMAARLVRICRNLCGTITPLPLVVRLHRAKALLSSLRRVLNGHRIFHTNFVESASL